MKHQNNIVIVRLLKNTHYFECEIQAPLYEFFFQLNRENCHIDWTDYKRPFENPSKITAKISPHSFTFHF